MRPDKKGKRKPHPGQAAKHAPKTEVPAARGAPAKTISAEKETAKPATPPTPAGPLGPPPRPPGDIGPRVLEPAAPVQQDKYRRREICSNWAKYELPPNWEPELEPGEDFRVGDTFEDILAAGGSGYFSLRSERSWLEESGSTSELLTLDVAHLADVLHRLPLHQRLDIDTKHFTEEELATQRAEAERPRLLPSVEREQTESIFRHTLSLLRGETPVADTAAARDNPAGGDAAQPLTSTSSVTAGTAALSVPPSPDVSAAISPASAATPSPVTDPSPTSTAASCSEVAPDAGEGVTSAPSALQKSAAPSSAPLLDEDWLDSVLSDED